MEQNWTEEESYELGRLIYEFLEIVKEIEEEVKKRE